LRVAAVSAVGAAFARTAGAQNGNLPDPPGTVPPPRDWNEPIVAYPDPAYEVFDPRGKKYSPGTAPVRRLFTGATWTEGPVYFADQHSVIFSDIPNNRMLRYDEMTGDTSLFREPSGHSNGNTRDRQGRLVTCEHDGRVTRTEYNGKITVLADNYQGKKLNSPNGVIVKSDDTIWFTDPSYGIMGDHEGNRRPEELPHNVYMIDPKAGGKMTVVAGDFDQPNGLCFSPDEKLLYITDTGKPMIRVFDVGSDNKLTNGRMFHDFKGNGLSDDIRADEDGNIWSAGGWASLSFNGVSVYAPDGTPIARIVLPETAGNLCFGGLGHNHSYLYICAGQSLYMYPVHTRGVEL
jgi:gluconolactonase